MPDPVLEQLHTHGACRGLPEHLFFDEELAGRAKHICDACPVRVECLAWAMTCDDLPAVYGVWGGTSRFDREKLLRYIPRKKCPLCEATRLHERPGQQTCLACGVSWPTVRPSAHTRTGGLAGAA